MTLPDYITLTNWAHTLVVDFPKDNIPFLKDENNWKEWGNMLIQENSFSRNAAPGTQNYSDWQSWAKAVFYAMAGT